MANDYIDLDRRFVEIQDDKDLDPETVRWSSVFSYGSKSWDEILEHPRVVILAEAGVGKTEECKAQARVLTARGQFAVFCPVEDVAQEGFPECLSFEDDESYQAWLATDEHGYLLLDSVDEAKLANHPLRKALRRLSKGLGRARDRMHVVVTCRVSDWQATADRKLVAEYLPLPRKKEKAEARYEEPGEVDWNDLTKVNDDDKKESADPDVLVVGLAALNSDRIETFITNCGVKDISSFMQALGDGDLWDFADRPQDLLDLIAYWNVLGQFGTHTDMMAFNIDQKLKEASTQPVRRQDELDLERARIGAQSIAAAMTLGHRSFVVLPDAPIDPRRRFNALPPDDVLPDWAPAHQGKLLTRPLFDEGTYGRTQFHHRSAREFLTAKWLKQRLDDGHRRLDIERLLFDSRYGVDVAIPSMAPVLGWLANWDEGIRNRTMAIAPEVLIAHGDPEVIPLDVRADLLRQYAGQYAEQRDYTGHSFDRQSLKRIAHKDLTPTVLELIDQYTDNHDVTKLLLRLAREGHMHEVADIALRLALDEEKPGNVRVYAVRAVGAIGGEGHHNELIDYIVANGNKRISALCAECLEMLFPHVLKVDDFIKITATVGTDSDRYRYMLSEVLTRDLSLEDRNAILSGLLDIVEALPHVDPEDQSGINESSNKLAKYVAEALTGLLNQVEPIKLDHELISRALDCLGRCNQHRALHYEFSEREVRQAIRMALVGHPEFKRERFWDQVAVETAKAGGIVPTNPYAAQNYYDMWQLSADDFPWLKGDISTRENADERALALVCASATSNELPDRDAAEKELREIVSGDKNLEEVLDQYLNPTSWQESEAGLRHAKHSEEHRQKMDAMRRARIEGQERWKENAQKNLENIRNAKDFSALHTIAKLMGKFEGGSRWGQTKWSSLVPALGDEIAEAGRDGLMAFWRTFTPELLSDRTGSDGISHGTYAGLCGLAIEHQNVDNWAVSLSAEEAVIATHYATWEINGFPDWLPELAEIYPDEVRDVLAHEIEHELKTAADEAHPHNVLSALGYCDDTIRALMAPAVQELVTAAPPANFHVLDDALRILLISENIDQAALGRLAADCAKEHEEHSSMHFTWMVVWYCMNAIEAQDYVDGRLPTMDGVDADAYVMALFTALFNHGRERRYGHIHASYNQIPILERMLRMVYVHVRRADDNQHEGSYTPDTRDDAESARNTLLSLLCDTPGSDSYDALLSLAAVPEMEQSRDVMLSLAKRRAENDAEPNPWLPVEVVEFAARRGKSPVTAQELFEITMDRLDDIRRAAEDGDYSQARLFVGKKDEDAVQLFFADELNRASRGHYTLEREPEVVNRKEPDIRLKSNAVKGPISIEVKVADSWSGNKLLERLENQLVGQYMRAEESRHGIFLLTYHGIQGGWDIDGKRRSFPELLDILQHKANELKAASKGEISELVVIGVDFTKTR